LSTRGGWLRRASVWKVLQLQVVVLSKRKPHLRIRFSAHGKRATVLHQKSLDMRQQDRQRVSELGLLIDKEQDHTKCRELIKELIDILERSSKEVEEKSTA
jgi:hypothetical protein